MAPIRDRTLQFRAELEPHYDAGNDPESEATPKILSQNSNTSRYYLSSGLEVQCLEHR